MPISNILKIITRGTVEIINLENLNKKLEKSQATGKPLVIKAGFDPTAPDIHLGHVVLLRKMRQFQDLGHRVVFLIGDFTAQVGDPTGRNELRKKMSVEEIERNAATYKEQVFKVLSPQKTEVVFNSTWFNKFKAQDLMELSARATVAQMLARADFKKRFEDGREISLLEFIYPMLQGYDSVELKADVELGGSDQKFNLLMGRQVQESYGQEPQVVIMTPLLEGLDGINKMSKSLGNYIGINEPPNDIFGKVMSISDELMLRYYELLTDANIDEIKKMHPKEAKLSLAGEIVRQFHGEEAAKAAREYFESVFSQKNIPEDIQEFSIAQGCSVTLLDILVRSNVVPTKNEARRLLKQNAITFEVEPVTDEGWSPKKGVLKVGKRRFLKLV
jgi:tyrosyl-tRNA synthetase